MGMLFSSARSLGNGRCGQQKLQHEMDQLDDKDSYTCRSLQRSHSKAQKQLQTMRRSDKAKAKRADGWIGVLDAQFGDPDNRD